MSLYMPGDKKSCLDCDCKSELFAYLSESEIKEINNIRTISFFKKNEIIAKQGTPANYFITLRKGYAKLNYEGADRKTSFIGILQLGDISAGTGFLVDGRYHFTYTALTEVEVCLIDSEFIKSILFSNNTFCEAFLRSINIKHTQFIERNHSNNHKNMIGRVAEALLIMSSVIFRKNAFDMLISRQDFADFTSMKKESLIRSLKEIKENRIIDLNKNFVEILDVEKLGKLSKYS
jgi:CRP/FNR family transcriptional regulator, polysaccharide utilization system transcription regulator